MVRPYFFVSGCGWYLPHYSVLKFTARQDITMVDTIDLSKDA